MCKRLKELYSQNYHLSFYAKVDSLMPTLLVWLVDVTCLFILRFIIQMNAASMQTMLIGDSGLDYQTRPAPQTSLQNPANAIQPLSNGWQTFDHWLLLFRTSIGWMVFANHMLHGMLMRSPSIRIGLLVPKAHFVGLCYYLAYVRLTSISRPRNQKANLAVLKTFYSTICLSFIS